MLASLLVVLPRPGTWMVALAAFLLRGGLLVFLVPILVVPSPVELATAFGPSITSFVFGGLSPAFALAVGAIFATFLAWLLVGGWIAAATERVLVETVAADDEVAALGEPSAPPGPRRGTTIARTIVLRLAGHVPLAVALAWGSLRVVRAAYAELTLPSDVTVPIALRVLAAVPDAVAAIVVAWILGEVLGALATRRVMLRGQHVDAAYLGAWADLLRRPATTLATFAVPAAVLVVVVVPIVAAAGVAWGALRVVLATSRSANPLEIVLLLAAFVAVWCVALVVAGLVSAWRSAAWTVEVLRARTIGSAPARQPGDWIDLEPSGRL